MAMGHGYQLILKDLFPPGRLINTEYFYRGLGYSHLICFQTGMAFSILEYLHTNNTFSNNFSDTINNTFGSKFNEYIGIKDTTIIVDSFIAKTISGVTFYPLDTIRTIIRSNDNNNRQSIIKSLNIIKLYNGLGYYLLRSVPAFVIVNYIHSKLINL
jgi:hypothetical protein